MSWKLYRWTWRVESPLFVGATPAGALNRCRLYVPARAIWGAVTAETARFQNDSFPKYEQLGNEISMAFRFSYLYPAEQSGGHYVAWLPKYIDDQGLLWCREDKHDLKDALLDRVFRRRLLHTRSGTAIEPSSDSAHEGSLRETECIQPYWRNGSNVSFEPVYLVGYVFCTEDEAWHKMIETCNILFIGGDTRYGQGKVRLEKIEQAGQFFGSNIKIDMQSAPLVHSRHVWGHASSKTKPLLTGALELYLGWLNGRQVLPVKEAFYTPGSSAENENAWQIRNDGMWE